MSGREIGETLFNLLDAGQQQEFLAFALEVQKLTGYAASPLSLPAEHRKKNLLTEAQMGDQFSIWHLFWFYISRLLQSYK